MSFWKSFGFHSVTALDQLLDSGNFTLEQLMDEEDILQEVKGQNKKLIDFLVEEPSLKKLLVYVTDEAPEDADQKRKFKYPFIACEILASEVWALCDAFYAHPGLLDKLYGLLEKDPPLNPMLTSYTCRVAAILLSKKIPETIGFLKGKKDIIPLFIKHLGNASIMDLLLKIISAQDPLADNPNQTLDWLCTTELIPSLIKKMDPKTSSEEVIENASQALVDIITASNSVPNSPLIDQLESQDMLKQFLEFMLSSGFSPALLHGSSVLIHLLARHAQPTTDDKPLEQLPVLLQQIASRLSSVRDLLQSAGSSSGKSEQNGNNNNGLSLSIYHSSVGDIVPLGFHRLRLIEFLGALVTTNYQCIDMLLLQLNIFTLCFDLFFAHPWNNFLHQAVLGMLEGIYSGKHDKLKVALIVECKLLDRLTVVVKEEDSSSKNGGLRKGFMGHVTKMSVILIDAAKEDEKLQTLLNEHKSWQEYVAGSLRETQAKEQVAAEYLAHQAALQQSQQQQQDQGDETVEEQVDDRIDTTESE